MNATAGGRRAATAASLAACSTGWAAAHCWMSPNRPNPAQMLFGREFLSQIAIWYSAPLARAPSRATSRTPRASRALSSMSWVTSDYAFDPRGLRARRLRPAEKRGDGSAEQDDEGADEMPQKKERRRRRTLQEGCQASGGHHRTAPVGGRTRHTRAALVHSRCRGGHDRERRLPAWCTPPGYCRAIAAVARMSPPTVADPPLPAPPLLVWCRCRRAATSWSRAITRCGQGRNTWVQGTTCALLWHDMGAAAAWAPHDQRCGLRPAA